MVNVPVFTDEDFKQIFALVRRRFGIYLGPQKRSLVFSRLQKLVRANGFDNFSQYLQFVRNDKTGTALAALADRISTNHTYFNREAEHFEFFNKTILPLWLEGLNKKKRPGKLRIWSAGCSTGEEAYQIAISLAEAMGILQAKNNAAILATDISRKVLQNAKEGRFAFSNVRNLHPTLIKKYFNRATSEQVEVKPFLKELILFRRLNLMRPQYPFKRQFYVIFCRNVMIYFDEPTKQELIEKFYRYLEPGGFLLIGHAEVLNYKNSYFKYIQPAIYVKES